jgi:CubicO group peptidase (beta-lactamase class C family)
MSGLRDKVSSWFRHRSKTDGRGPRPRESPRRANRVLRLEPLERREMMAADPISQDPTATAWHSYHDLTTTQWAQVFAERKVDSIPVDIEITDVNGSARIGAIWNKNTDGRGWALLRNLTGAEFGQKWAEYRDQGYRLADQETYDLGGSTYYAGIWIQNTEGAAWASKRDLTAAGYQSFFDTYRSGYIPVDVDIDSTGGSLKYSAVFVENTKNLDWTAHHGLTSAAFGDLFDQLKGTHRVTDIESYQVGGQQRYAAVWVRNTDGRGWVSLRDMTEVSYWNNWNAYSDLGYRLVDFERYQTAGGWRYAGVWRQDGDRLNWGLKGQVDALAAGHLADFNVPGLSVAVVQDGKFLYRRGFGHQDKAAGLQYSALTVNRLASVSKAVAGVLAKDLVESGLLDINRTTRSYVPTMPVHHTHTLRQLLSNRAGVGHYGELGDVTGSYDTALAASQQFWSQALLFTPGTGYHYSTHGYSLLGAAIEGALQKPIRQVVRQYLTDKFGLGTLRVEDRSVADRYRSAIYNNSNQAVAADDLSWKVLGGGLESSAVDLASFGARLLSGGILTAASRNDLWTAPDNLQPYGLGWDLGQTRGGARRVEKSGSQLGANTHLLAYPEKGIVVAVLSNRAGGHDASDLARRVGALLVS